MLLSILGRGGAFAQTPPAPRSVEAIAFSANEIRVFWLPASGASGYRVERDGRAVATLPADAVEYRDAGLVPDTVYHYTVQAVQGDASSPARSYTERTFAPFPAADGRKQAAATFDVVVVQASSGGVAAAIEAGRRGLRVALVEPTTRLGGMPVNGLSATDLRRNEHASGIFVRFRDRVRAMYAEEGVKTNGISYEPRVAHRAMKSLLYEAPNITIYRRARLISVHTVVTQPGTDAPGPFAVSPNFSLSTVEAKPAVAPRRRVDSVVIEELDASGKPTGRRAALNARIFVDSTDTGDLAAWAGAPFHKGREARTPEEPHAGVIYYDRGNDKLLPGSTGEGDTRMPSYAYLLTVKDYGPGADKTITMPPEYRKEDYIHTPDWPKSWAVSSGTMPNNKHEINQHPQGSNFQGINYAYPLGDYNTRERTAQRYRNRVFGYLYYIQTVQGFKQIGLPEDEYRDSGGFPSLLYVREGRRILGEQLPLEADITNARKIVRPESIGIGDYPMDSHAVRLKTDWTTPDFGEGEWWLYKQTPWHELPLGIIVPRDLDNVFVTTSVSSTHVSYGTYREEPVRMAFGQAAGIAADLCLRFGMRGRDVPARQIQDDLLPHAANPLGDPSVYLSYLSDVPFGSRRYEAIQYLAARGFKLSDEQFKPNAPTTRGELARCLRLLAVRAAPRGSFYPLMGPSADLSELRDLEKQPDPSTPITRAELAGRLARLLPTVFRPVGSSRRVPYTDIRRSRERAAIGQLWAAGIDSRLWDGMEAYAPQKALKFRPDAPVTHSDLAIVLFVVQRYLGPLFRDLPADRQNSR